MVCGPDLGTQAGNIAMTKTTQTLGPDGKLHPATVVDVNESVDRWTEIRLDDGSVLRTKIVVVEVSRLNDMYDEELNPVYSVKSNTVVVVSSVPENLRAKRQ